MKKKITYFKKFYLVILSLLVNSFLSFQMSFAMKDMIDAGTAQNWDLFWDKSILLIIYVVAFFPSNLLTAYLKNYFVKDAITRMKTDYMHTVFGKNINEFQKDNNASYVSALSNDFNFIENDYIRQIIVFAEGFISFATGIVIYAIISPLILGVGLGIVLINGLISNLVSKPIDKHNTERSKLFADYGGFIKEALSAFSIIKNNSLEPKIRANYVQKSETVQHKKYVIDKIMSFIFAAQNANFTIIFLGVMLFVSYLTLTGVVTFAGVVVIVNNIDKLIGPVANLSEAFPKIRSVKSIFVRIDQTLKEKSFYPETEPFSGFKKDITFQNVSFAYDDNLVLKNIDLTFEKGKKYLLIGPSGGGKSTVLRLLRKYFNPGEGTILIDGVPLKDVIKQEYFARIANIEQMVFLFEDTLRNNLTLFKEFSPEDIADAIEKAGLTDFVKSNPEGLDYMIYDNGKNISGGEKSRIAIARGLLNHADIIFLDEAFASLDRERAKEIEQGLGNLTGVTLINVSHVIIEENKSIYDKIIMVKNKSVVVTS